MGTALTIKSNDPCDLDHIFEVFHLDVRDSLASIAPCPCHVRSTISETSIVRFCRVKASIRT